MQSFFANVSTRHCLQTESALPSSWNAVISVSDYMGTLKQYCGMNLFWFEIRAEFFSRQRRQLANIGKKNCWAFFSNSRLVDFEGYEAEENFLVEGRDICYKCWVFGLGQGSKDKDAPV